MLFDCRTSNALGTRLGSRGQLKKRMDCLALHIKGRYPSGRDHDEVLVELVAQHIDQGGFASAGRTCDKYYRRGRDA